MSHGGPARRAGLGDAHQELARKGVTLALLWQEYKAQQPDGYQYSRFCDRYGALAGQWWLRKFGQCAKWEPGVVLSSDFIVLLLSEVSVKS